jgi:tetratricopeptide (TPR) repeat protein
MFATYLKNTLIRYESIFGVIESLKGSRVNGSLPSPVIDVRWISWVTSVAVFCMAFVAAPQFAQAQQGALNTPSAVGFPVFPRAEYYMAREWLRDGNTNAGIQDLLVTIRLGSQVNNRRGIDAVPAMVMLGECYYQQGNLAAALEQFDAALELSIAQVAWLGAVEPMPAMGEFSPPAPKGINWYTSVRGSRLPSYTNRWPIVITYPGLFLTMPSGIALPAGEIYTIDALEVLRSQAFALRRRWMILGPLASKFPLTQSISALFGPPAPNLSPPIEASLAICQAYALLAAGESGQAEKILQSYVTMAGGADHNATALALLGLADLAAAKSDFANASQLLLESTVVAARLMQYEHMAEAVRTLSAIAATQRDRSAIPVFRQIGLWAKGKSSMLIAQSMASMIETQVAVGDLDSAATVFQEATNIRSARDIYLPRVEAQFLYSAALAAAAKIDIPNAMKFSDQAIVMATRSNPVSFSSPRIFRLRLWENLYRNGQFDRQTAFALAGLILAEPSEAEWKLDPLDCLAWLSLDKITAYDAAIQLMLRKKDTTALIQLVDQSQRHLFHKMTPLGGRLQSVRMLFHAERDLLPASAAKDVVKLKANYPQVQQLGQSIEQALRNVQLQPMEFNVTKWSKDFTQLWNQATNMSATQEAAMWRIALSRETIPQVFPPPVDVAALRKELPDGEAALCIFPAEGNMHGFFISRTEEKYWQSISTDQFSSMLQLLLGQIGIFDEDPQANPAWAKREWDATTAEFQKLLFPKDILKSLSKTKKVFIVPTGNAWYLPFELLPIDPTKGPAAWISARRLVYLPSLGFTTRCLTPHVPQKTKLLVVSEKNFFSIDERQNRQFINDLQAGIPTNYEIAIGRTDENLQDSKGARLQPTRVIVSAKQKLENPATFKPFAYDWTSQTGSLSNWLVLPLAGPRELIMPGVSLAGHDTLTNEAFLLACSLMANGTRSVLVSRWPVRGASSHLVISNYQKELDFISASEALQRSIFDLWATELDAATEPVLDFKPGAPNVVKGTYPIFWATYMQIGDTNPKTP